MASKVVVTKEKLNNIGDAIRNQLGVTTKYALDEMPDAIRAISGGGSGGTGTATVTVTTSSPTFYGKRVTLTDGVDTMATNFSNNGVAVFNKVEMEGELTASVTVAGTTYSTTVTVYSNYSAILEPLCIYGAYWDGSANQQFVRTDDSADFDDPIPAIGAGASGSSPFDTLYPWSEMNIVEDPECGTMVKIPKFYYKLETRSTGSLSIKIANRQTEGFHVCPACADRGDGTGERDYVLVGRYLCANNCKSTSGDAILGGRTRSQFRTSIHELGDRVFQYDFMTHVTIWFLYLVEYANWNSQNKIGWGGPASNAITGGTDNMLYHTGSTEALGNVSRVQYRNIEDLWSAKTFFCDGIYFQNQHVFIIKNPLLFDESGGTDVGTRARTGGTYSEVIRKFEASEVDGYDWCLIVTENGGHSDSDWDTYIGDGAYSIDGGPLVLFASAGDSNHGTNGLFHMAGGNSPGATFDSAGCRCIKLP